MHDVLRRRHVGEPDRAARVQARGRVRDLGSEPELAAVGEARRGVHVHAGRADAADERVGGAEILRHDRLGVPGAVGLDVVDRLLDRVDGAHGEHQVEVLGRPVLLGRQGGSARRAPRRRPRRRAARRRASRSATPIGASSGSASRWTSSVSAALHTPGRCVFALTVIASAFSGSAVGVEIDVAVAAGGGEHRHARVLDQEVLELLAAARDHDVARLRVGDERGELVAAAGEVDDGVGGQPGVLEPGAHRVDQDGVRAARARAAAQDARVAALDRERGDVGRHVRARLVDDEQHAERDAHLLDVEPVRQAPAGDDRRRPGRRAAATDAHGGGERRDARRVERQPVEQRARSCRRRGHRRRPPRSPRRSRRRRARCAARSPRAPRPSCPRPSDRELARCRPRP